MDVTADSPKNPKSELYENGENHAWNLPSRKSPIEQLLEHRAMQVNGGISGLQPSQTPFQSALGITPSTLQSIYANPVFHQNLRTASVLQSRGITPQTLPLLLPQNQPLLNSTSKMVRFFGYNLEKHSDFLSISKASSLFLNIMSKFPLQRSTFLKHSVF